MSHPKISIVIPAYKEAESIGDVVGKIRSLHPDAEVIVIDDGSQDKTAERAAQAGASVYCHPYNIGNGATALLSSKEYHPTADINLQRADMLDGLSYYNCDVHPAAFAMGNYIRKEYLGIIKN